MMKARKKTVRTIVAEEIKLMKEYKERHPYDEPEPTYRFDLMTEEERHYVAKELGL
jgi:hypothetical protein